LGPSDLTHGHTYWLSCAVDGKRDEFSRADYVAFWNLGYFEEDPVGDQNFTYASLEESLTDAFVPTWLSMYGVSDEADLVEYELRPELLNDTLFLYNSSSELIAPRGAFSGGARFTWTNANLGWKSPISNWGIVTTDSEGNVQLTENYDRLREIFSDMNTENWLSGESVPEYNIPACKKEDMVNTTTEMYIDDATTMTIATDWQLPTRPAGLDALITSGVSGTRGQMVDVTITTIVHTVRDSQGNVVTNLALSPSKSESRTTTGAPEETNIINPPVTPESGLSTGAKAGIGAGAAVAGLAVIGAAGFFLLRRHRNSKAAKAAKEDEIQLSDHDSKGGFHKAELATGDEVERKHAELAAQDGKTPQEVAAMEAGGGIFEMNAGSPVELPAHEQTLELPAQSRGEEAQNPRRD
jgi:hypothetical protein